MHSVQIVGDCGVRTVNDVLTCSIESEGILMLGVSGR
jgi:hypothetical protein